ncbi:PTS sugar transporter subunit IIB [Rathayibacter iranicus]|uniref:PTS ascorbate transporter subunit IIB n=2 Tax=Rathayibacter iranicus TaxID=59737 RepID=A0AAD1ACY8_9MICO|nr:PTS sugar transporter subunit IIB [Rathayibacter iranicus]AZZ55819.1 PTS ascorbate transporter subunit IIB [Rathayibacter iranicus]MWV30748.1 PTS ascorbate transporter subunit IIB [Rathayibacter iranicus NCPPB 2253 = VKM Ac-1602]PPI47588.1 PTS ascorbate transporter subunit IIB [Rathayibacter iranicus]PPI60433.1 PTS ascorbate transporter subunit IIB [Rathayibacter iranicus]PPI71922.1 PTS ascorbate transporter subunit IIB [Rathayibacter iranicus]
MKIITLCGAGIGTSAILKLGTERALESLDLDAEVIASDLDSVDALAADAQIILTSGELVGRLGPTFAEVVVIDNYLDQNEITAKIKRALA